MLHKYLILGLLLPAIFVQGNVGIGKLTSIQEVNGKAFEDKIMEKLEELRDLLKNGKPEENVPPMEPLEIPEYAFDIILSRDTRLNGYIDHTLIHHISDFNVTFLKFDTLKKQLFINVKFEELLIDGDYKALGLMFNETVAGEGSYVSNTTDLEIELMVHLGSNLWHSQIKELTLSFVFANDYILFSNKMTGESNLLFDNDFMTDHMYRIRDIIFPELLETLRLVGTDIIYELTIDEVINCLIGDCIHILGIFNQNKL